MESLIAIGYLLGLTTILAGVLAVASQKLKVYEDPRIDVVNDMMPGTNCGSCGLPGCRAFAENVIAGNIQPSGCPVGGAATAQLVADFLGVEAGEAEPMVARLRCAGGSNVAIQMAEYQGQPTCRAAASVAGGTKGCRYGCLGFGDCDVACTFDAITMSETGLPIVDPVKCTSCGDCVRACPKDLFEIVPMKQKLFVQCKSVLEGDGMLDFCKVACTACGRCVADAPQGLLKMEHNLPVLNEELLSLQDSNAIKRCPTGAITWIEGQQFKSLMNRPKDVVSKS
ncbi:RnfABCDGE type electron transport complex subunit B [bacterium]|nr:RnfABCDGE type electron transport complex subunit B [bacterium]